MQTEHYLCFMYSSVKFVHSKGISLSPPVACYDRSKAAVVMYFLLYVIWGRGFMLYFALHSLFFSI